MNQVAVEQASQQLAAAIFNMFAAMQSTVNDAPSSVEKAFAEPAALEPAPEQIEEAGEEVTLDDLRMLFADKSRAGFREKLTLILQEFKARKLPEVDEADYAALKRKVEALQ